MQDVFRVHDVARIRTGRYAGLVGTVTDTKQNAGRQTGVRVRVDGVRDGEKVSAHVWLRVGVKTSDVERNSNG